MGPFNVLYFLGVPEQDKAYRNADIQLSYYNLKTYSSLECVFSVYCILGSEPDVGLWTQSTSNPSPLPAGQTDI